MLLIVPKFRNGILEQRLITRIAVMPKRLASICSSLTSVTGIGATPKILISP